MRAAALSGVVSYNGWQPIKGCATPTWSAAHRQGILALVASLAFGVEVGRQQVAFRTGVDIVALFVTVSDNRGRLVPDLSESDFEILEDGQPVEIATFSRDPQPITVAVMLDMSASRTGTFLRVREGMLQFVEALLPQDRMRIGTYGDEISISPLLTGSKRELVRVLNEELWPGGDNPHWNALDVAMDSLSDESGRRVILVVTDSGIASSLPGRDSGYPQVYARATREGFMHYAVSLPLLVNQQGRSPSALSSVMIELARDTGGGYIDMATSDDVATTFRRIAVELRHQFAIGFRPHALDGKQHELKIRLKPKGLTARARQSYVAAHGR